MKRTSEPQLTVRNGSASLNKAAFRQLAKGDGWVSIHVNEDGDVALKPLRLVANAVDVRRVHAYDVSMGPPRLYVGAALPDGQYLIEWESGMALLRKKGAA